MKPDGAFYVGVRIQDAAFIAASRTALPELLDEVAALRAKLISLQTAMRDIGDYAHDKSTGPAAGGILSEDAASAKARLIARSKDMLRLRDILISIQEGLETDVDRVCFGSMNDADDFRDTVELLDDWEWSVIMKDAEGEDLLAELKDRNDVITLRNTQINELREEFAALKAELAARDEDIELLRARAPRKYILTRKLEWVRLFQEVHGYLRTCHAKHGTDQVGRNHAMNALIQAVADLEDEKAANKMKLADINEMAKQNSAKEHP
jgi:hypothetical protein